MNCLSTLRIHALTIFLTFFLATTLASQTIVLSVSATAPPCMGTSMTYIIVLANANIIANSSTDNNLMDGITISDSCPGCNTGTTSVYFVSINLASGTIGSTETFTASLTSSTGFFPTSHGTIVGNTITFPLSILVDQTPAVAVTPSSTELCDGSTENLAATVTNSASTQSYSWAADGGDSNFSGGSNPGNSSVAVAQGADTYRVTVTNQCGNGTALATTTTNNTPSIQLDCTHNGNGTTTITADILNTATGVDVSFYNNGSLHSSSNNNTGPGGDPSITVSDITFDQQVFTATASNSCGNASITGSCLVLPVELLFFKGAPLDKSIMLEWATATELNNDFFTVERSFDGRNFTPVGIIEGAGNSQVELYYDFVDKDVTAVATESSIYYRLKQTDFDGNFTYSEIIVLQIDPQNFFDILQQNFEDENLKLAIYNPQASPLEVQLFDLNGRLIRQLSLPPSQGRTELSLYANNLKAGFYVVSVSNGQQRVSRKVAKLE